MSKFKKLNESASYEDYKKQHEIKSPPSLSVDSTVTGKAIEVEKGDAPKDEKDHVSYKRPTEPYTLGKYAAIVNSLAEKSLGKGASADVESTPKTTKLEVEKHTAGKVNESEEKGKDLQSIVAALKEENPDLTAEQLWTKAGEVLKQK